MRQTKWSRFKRYEVSDTRHRELFDRREGEDPYQMIARQLTMAKPYELAWLYLLRDDPKQREAMMLLQQARTAFWARLAVIMSALALPVAVGTALIARG
jgi:hypothetical protein